MWLLCFALLAHLNCSAARPRTYVRQDRLAASAEAPYGVGVAAALTVGVSTTVPAGVPVILGVVNAGVDVSNTALVGVSDVVVLLLLLQPIPPIVTLVASRPTPNSSGNFLIRILPE